MELSELTAISPIDGRYGARLSPLKAIFSEYGLIKYRTAVEVAWLIVLSEESGISEVPALSAEIWNSDKFNELREIHMQKRFDEIPLCKNCIVWEWL